MMTILIISSYRVYCRRCGRKYKFNYNGIKLTDTDIFYTHFVVSVNYLNQINEAHLTELLYTKVVTHTMTVQLSTELDDK